MKFRWPLGIAASCAVAFFAGLLFAQLVWGRPSWFRMLWTAEAAGWAAAIATLAAVYGALNAAKKEREKSIEIQTREWLRLDEQRKSKAARLAHAFNRDLVRAHQEIRLVRSNLMQGMKGRDLGWLAEYLLKKRKVISLPMIDRFANELDGFEDRDALALLNMVASCSDISRKIDVAFEEMSLERAMRIAENISGQAAVIAEELVKLNDRIIVYFQDFPDMKIVDDDSSLGGTMMPLADE